MQTSVIHTPLQDNKVLLKVFFWDLTGLKFDIGQKGEKNSLRNTSRMQKRNLFVKISRNTTYKQPILLIFRPLSKNFRKSGRDENFFFHIRILQERS